MRRSVCSLKFDENVSVSVVHSIWFVLSGMTIDRRVNIAVILGVSDEEGIALLVQMVRLVWLDCLSSLSILIGTCPCCMMIS